MRHLHTRELERLLADQLGHVQLGRDVAALAGGVVGGALRQQLHQVAAQLIHAVAGERADRVQRMELAEPRGVLHLLRDVPRLEPVDLVQRDHDRHAQPEHALGDVAVAGPDPLAGREHEQDGVDLLERLVDRALHPLGQRVTRPLETWQVGEHELVVGPVGDPHHAPAGGLRLVRDDRHLASGERVDERRLPDVRPPGHGDEPASQEPTPPPWVGKNARRPRR